VFGAADGQALRRALVVLSVDGRVRGKTSSDDEGRFEIDVPGGVTYTLAVTKSGYLGSTLRQSAARSPRISLEISLVRAAVIAGRVLDPSGNPVVSVRVRLQRAEAGAAFEIWATTDDLGTYRVGGLLPGRYRIETIGGPEYTSSLDSLRRLSVNVRDQVTGNNPLISPSSDATVIDAVAGAVADAAVAYRGPAVILPYANVGGAIAGQISDETGEPAVGLSVQLWRLEVDNGVQVATRYNAARTTDDRGQYRMFHIKAGRYALVVTDDTSPTGAGESSWLPVYYPGTAAPAEAVALNVGRSQELPGTDMVFAHVAGLRVFGTALNGAGQPLQSGISLIAPNQDLPITPTKQIVQVAPDGAFSFESVPPGDYVVRAAPDIAVAGTTFVSAGGVTTMTRSTGQRENEFAMQSLHVADADIGPLAIRTAPTATLRGRVTYEGVPPVRSSFRITAFTTDPLFNLTGRVGDGTISEASVDSQTGSFELARLIGPVRLHLTVAPLNAWLKSAYIGGVNAVESPVMFTTSRDSRDDVTIVVATTAATISGRTTATSGQPLPGMQVIAFPTDRERWFIGSPYVHSIYSNETGLFTLTTVPPGEYWIVAIDSDENQMQRREQDRTELFDSLIASARRVTLGEGQALTVSPRIVAIGK
jgi:protocatechuate 3,4-dioxygenase beta subunit